MKSMPLTSYKIKTDFNAGICYWILLCFLLLFPRAMAAQKEKTKLYPGFWSEKLIDKELRKIYYHDKIKDKPLSGSYYWFPNEGQMWYYVDIQFVKGYPEGEAKFYKYNKLVSEATYREGVLDGIEYEYYSNGAIKKETFYIRAKKNGTEVHYRQSGEIEKEINFRDGVLDGTTKEYNTSGELIKEEYYVHGVPDGKHWAIKNRRRYIETVYQEGKIIVESEYVWPDTMLLRNTSYAFVNGKNVKNGMEILYSDKGVLTNRNYYNHGVDSLQIQYWENGAKKIEKRYKKGKLDMISTYTSDRKSVKKESFVEGRRTSVSTYDKEGLVAERKFYKNGKETGDYILYYPNGKQKETVRGEKKTAYYENGQVKSRSVFEKGRWIEVERMDEDGNGIDIE